MSDVMQDFLPPVEEDDAFDEHFWADPNLMITETEAIRDAIIRLDPSHEVEFRSNADIFLQELRNLDQEYREGLASCETRIAVTSHAAFGYLAKRYDFEQRPIMGLSPEAEPSAGELAALAETARASGVKYIFFETLASPKLSQTLANEIGAQTLVFNPVEGLTSEELEAGEDYLSVMRQNLTNLRTAMLCR
jgi:zinc transport system substrate-binding protein